MPPLRKPRVLNLAELPHRGIVDGSRQLDELTAGPFDAPQGGAQLLVASSVLTPRLYRDDGFFTDLEALQSGRRKHLVTPRGELVERGHPPVELAEIEELSDDLDPGFGLADRLGEGDGRDPHQPVANEPAPVIADEPRGSLEQVKGRQAVRRPGVDEPLHQPPIAGVSRGREH